MNFKKMLNIFYIIHCAFLTLFICIILIGFSQGTSIAIVLPLSILALLKIYSYINVEKNKIFVHINTFVNILFMLAFIIPSLFAAHFIIIQSILLVDSYFAYLRYEIKKTKI